MGLNFGPETGYPGLGISSIYKTTRCYNSQDQYQRLKSCFYRFHEQARLLGEDRMDIADISLSHPSKSSMICHQKLQNRKTNQPASL
jgi:hypothetical protein